MKNYIMLISLLLIPIMIPVQVFAEAPLVTVFDDAFAPFSYTEDGEIKGIDVEIIQEMARRMGIQLRIELVPWKRLLEMTQRGLCDFAGSLFKNRERETFAYFTYPLHYSTYVLCVKKDAQFKFEKISDLYGKSLCKPAGFIISEEFDEAEKQGKINVEEVYKMDSSILRTIFRKVDGFVANKYELLHYIKTNKRLTVYRDQLDFLKKPLKAKRGAFLVISKRSPRSGNQEFRNRITQTLSKMENEGFYQKIINQYIQ